ncbi:hypothetical protein DW145_09820 [Bifidobacterium bifidum]|uniref:Uncharacterized protein n=1 Tax=Bifidobacterium bifidum TaxID=1681 RepID=A0A415C308_BIFBI|nr:hypothetical protein DXD34_09340 [Bifidobacterium bifidum]RHA93615.1 hypothetical protein DW909_07980 [Bifidobacterium bifidum]RHJ03207.1 hypothetical protein DW145_09820 [Bifidobacterium bifidum]RHJ22039.1 hypothetical protein DW137_09425 [Bifidobacterium bifidum]
MSAFFLFLVSVSHSQSAEFKSTSQQDVHRHATVGNVWRPMLLLDTCGHSPQFGHSNASIRSFSSPSLRMTLS